MYRPFLNVVSKSWKTPTGSTFNSPLDISGHDSLAEDMTSGAQHPHSASSPLRDWNDGDRHHTNYTHHEDYSRGSTSSYRGEKGSNEKSFLQKLSGEELNDLLAASHTTISGPPVEYLSPIRTSNTSGRRTHDQQYTRGVSGRRHFGDDTTRRGVSDREEHHERVRPTSPRYWDRLHPRTASSAHSNSHTHHTHPDSLSPVTSPRGLNASPRGGSSRKHYSAVDAANDASVVSEGSFADDTLSLRTKLQRSRSELDRANELLAEVRKREEEGRVEVQSLKTEVEELRTQLEEQAPFEDEVSQREAMRQIFELRHRYEGEKEERERLEEEVALLNQSLSTRVDSSSTTVRAAKKESAEMRQQLPSLEAENAVLKDRLENQTKKLQTAQRNSQLAGDRQMSMKHVVESLLASKESADVTDRLSGKFWDHFGSVDVLNASEPPGDYPVSEDLVLQVTVRDMRHLKSFVAQKEKEAEELKTQLEDALESNIDIRNRQKEKTAKLVRQVEQHQTQLVGALRRVEWLMTEKKKLEATMEEKDKYTSRVEQKLIELNDALVEEKHSRNRDRLLQATTSSKAKKKHTKSPSSHLQLLKGKKKAGGLLTSGSIPVRDNNSTKVTRGSGGRGSFAPVRDKSPSSRSRQQRTRGNSNGLSRREESERVSKCDAGQEHKQNTVRSQDEAEDDEQPTSSRRYEDDGDGNEVDDHHDLTTMSVPVTMNERERAFFDGVQQNLSDSVRSQVVPEKSRRRVRLVDPQ